MLRSHATLALLLSLMSSFVLGKGVIKQPDPENILEMQDVPLVYVLEAIAAMDGREIVVKGDLQGYRVSVKLERDDLQRNLKRTLRGLSYALVFEAHNRLTIWLPVAGVGDSSGSSADVVIRPPPVSVAPASLFPDSPLVVPSDEEGKRGYTEADVAYYRSEQIPVDPALLEVVPDDEKERGTVTHTEGQQVTQSEGPLGSQVLVLPPAIPGEKGVTLEELESIRERNNEKLDFSRHDDVVPPD